MNKIKKLLIMSVSINSMKKEDLVLSVIEYAITILYILIDTIIL